MACRASAQGVHVAGQVGLIAQVLAVCAEHEITCLDLGPTLVEYAANDLLIVNRFDHHPNSWANALAAEATLAAFAPAWETAAEAKRTGAVAPGS